MFIKNTEMKLCKLVKKLNNRIWISKEHSTGLLLFFFVASLLNVKSYKLMLTYPLPLNKAYKR